jgi:hypothetical protein
MLFSTVQISVRLFPKTLASTKAAENPQDEEVQVPLEL